MLEVRECRSNEFETNGRIVRLNGLFKYFGSQVKADVEYLGVVIHRKGTMRYIRR